MGGRSRSSTSSSQQTNEVVTSLGDNRVSDTGSIGGNVQLGEAGGDVTVTTTDFGALDSAQTVSLAALDFGSDAVEGGFDLAGDSLISSQEVTEQAIDLSGDVFSGALDALSSSTQFFSEQSGKQFGQALDFASRSNTSEGTQVLQDGLKIVAVIAVVVGLMVVFKGNK